uniref:Cdx n=1 Tax=Herdmania curvata TaxID=62068 RepID=Q9NGR3_9ASCI|nr:Cdx [Herdmania curvata]
MGYLYHLLLRFIRWPNSRNYCNVVQRQNMSHEPTSINNFSSNGSDSWGLLSTTKNIAKFSPPTINDQRSLHREHEWQPQNTLTEHKAEGINPHNYARHGSNYVMQTNPTGEESVLWGSSEKFNRVLSIDLHNVAGHQGRSFVTDTGLTSSERTPYDWINRNLYQSIQPPAGKTRTKDKYRVVYSDHQRLELEKEFRYSRYITIRRKSELASQLHLSERQVKIWFQNRRAKERKNNQKKTNEIVPSCSSSQTIKTDEDQDAQSVTTSDNNFEEKTLHGEKMVLPDKVNPSNYTGMFPFGFSDAKQFQYYQENSSNSSQEKQSTMNL